MNEIVDEIYSILVERFNITEVFLPKYRKNRLQDITWKQFIKAALELEISDLYGYCGYAGYDTFSSGLSSKHPAITKDKGRRAWIYYLYTLVSKKRCSHCRSILGYESFSRNLIEKDGLNSVCKNCDNTRTQKDYKENKEVYAAKHKEYYENNKSDYYARDAKRRAAKLQASPNWANQIAIKQIYQTCPEGYHVDHIVPLQHPLVCGLHCEFNLQHLTAHENLSKGNRFEI
jgi:hypothetical protein